uniref:Uncharacterized protein n=1 Tax=Ananas comosus var. bracteatus TaxID=296719 RepID=A0A6V7PP21_ANACO|nr:unnamed protein product [Ananas comosus var. bracteatus]
MEASAAAAAASAMFSAPSAAALRLGVAASTSASASASAPSQPLHHCRLRRGLLLLLSPPPPPPRRGGDHHASRGIRSYHHLVIIIIHLGSDIKEGFADSLQYESGFLGGISDQTAAAAAEGNGAAAEALDPMEYLTNVLTSRVYDVAIESPFNRRPSSRRGSGSTFTSSARICNP